MGIGRKKLTAIQRKLRIRNTLVIFGVATFAIYLLLSADDPAEALASDEVIQLGQRVYAETCAACHGSQLEGHYGLPEAPALNGSEHSWHHADGQIQSLIEEGGMLMPALGNDLSDEEVFAVIRYIQTWWTADQLDFQQRASQGNPIR